MAQPSPRPAFPAVTAEPGAADGIRRGLVGARAGPGRERGRSGPGAGAGAGRAMAPAAVQPPEVQFAQRLAANEKRIRDRALKKLRGYIGVRTQRPAGTARGWARGWAEGTGTGIGTRTGPGAVAGAAAAPAGGRRGEGRKHHVCALSPARLLRGSSRRALFFFILFFSLLSVYTHGLPLCCRKLSPSSREPRDSWILPREKTPEGSGRISLDPGSREGFTGSINKSGMGAGWLLCSGSQGTVNVQCTE